LANFHIEEPDDKKNTVELWSISRLPFEPKGWLLDMRNSLRLAIKKMEPGEESVFKAVYTSNQLDFYDTENILIYNVGTGAFGPLCQKGLFLERRIQSPQQLAHKLPGKYLHHHLYSYSAFNNEPFWKKTKRLAHWDDIMCKPLKGEIKPHSIWYQFKKGYKSGPVGEFQYSSYYGIYLIINAPYKTKLNTAGIIKPLLDGIISAFHNHVFEIDETVIERLSIKLNEKKDVISNMLLDKEIAVLGPRNLIHPFRQGVQWNPSDDLFMQIEVKINKSNHDSNWSLSGDIYALEAITQSREYN